MATTEQGAPAQARRVKVLEDDDREITVDTEEEYAENGPYFFPECINCNTALELHGTNWPARVWVHKATGRIRCQPWTQEGRGRRLYGWQPKVRGHYDNMVGNHDRGVCDVCRGRIIRRDEQGAPWFHLEETADHAPVLAFRPYSIATPEQLTYARYCETYGDVDNYSVYGAVLEEQCASCGSWNVTDSVWGYEVYRDYLTTGTYTSQDEMDADTAAMVRHLLGDWETAEVKEQ